MNISEKGFEAIKDLLYKMADDQLIIGHRNSEWTGLGPVLEEDIAFSSMAQDKLGHSQALYDVLSQMGEGDPDTIAFMRNAEQFHCCHLVEYPIGEYEFSLMRHFFFDNAELLRFEMLADSSFEPLSFIAKKIKGEIKYHSMHADIWISQLGSASEESKIRMQNALNETFPLALGVFEKGIFEDVLKSEGIFEGEDVLKERWMSAVSQIIEKAGLKLPEVNSITPSLGGRRGKHTEYLQPLLDEMTEVFRIDPSAEW
ncbi:MAG: phenylacetate-CoA oxygenase subunit PaaC [Bacteroidetes bacterium]|nr:phenylacetate-CoA oxygenase subunit PaaC [Bacteroidota bacterium]